MAPNKSGALTPTTIVSTKLVKLEPIPSPPAPKAVATVNVEVTGINPVNQKPVTGNVIPQADGSLAVPRPGQADISVTVTTSDGTRAFTDVENAPPGTRIAVDLDRGVAGGHTRDAWAAATSSYGDKINVTGEKKIGFSLPDGKGPVELTAISYETEIGKGGSTKMKPQKDPKTIFEKRTDLDRFEPHARPYMSAKVASLKSPA